MKIVDYDRLDAYDSQWLRKILGIYCKTRDEYRGTAQKQAALSQYNSNDPSIFALLPHHASGTYDKHEYSTCIAHM